MGTVVLLVGPKAVGKSWVADTIQESLGVKHIDVDSLVIDLVSRGERPHATTGWLHWMEQSVMDGLVKHSTVSVEATGAWESD